MKKIIVLLLILFVVKSVNAEKKVGSYYCTYFSKSFPIEAALKNNELDNVYVGIEAAKADKAFISIDVKDIESFKTALMSIKDKYAEWCQVAKENNVTDLTKNFDIQMPLVTIAWYHGSGWKFDFGVKLDMKFMIMDDGSMIAVSMKDVVSSSNQYIDDTIYFAFGNVADFDGLVSVLNSDKILKELRTVENNKDLFQ